MVWVSMCTNFAAMNRWCPTYAQPLAGDRRGKVAALSTETLDTKVLDVVERSEECGRLRKQS
jgi:hypothetical protein